MKNVKTNAFCFQFDFLLFERDNQSEKNSSKFIGIIKYAHLLSLVNKTAAIYNGFQLSMIVSGSCDFTCSTIPMKRVR